MFVIVHLHAIVNLVEKKSEKFMSVLLATSVKLETSFVIAEEIDDVLWCDIVNIFAEEIVVLVLVFGRIRSVGTIRWKSDKGIKNWMWFRILGGCSGVCIVEIVENLLESACELASEGMGMCGLMMAWGVAKKGDTESRDVVKDLYDGVEIAGISEIK